MAQSAAALRRVREGRTGLGPPPARNLALLAAHLNDRFGRNEEHDGQTDHATWGPPMSLCVLCAQPTLGPAECCAYHIAGQTDDWAAGNRVMCDFLHRGIVGATPHDAADPSMELLDDSLEVALTS
jgi:hypothetical protein